MPSAEVRIADISHACRSGSGARETRPGRGDQGVRQSYDNERLQGTPGDFQVGVDTFLAAAPDGILVLDGDGAVVAAGVQRIDDAS
ncbi:MAG TPA: hypothetical protein VGI74_08260 [Streptosporangiaceae bacterium]